jgi:hypothetical protein
MTNKEWKARASELLSRAGLSKEEAERLLETAIIPLEGLPQEELEQVDEFRLEHFPDLPAGKIDCRALYRAIEDLLAQREG